MRRLFGLLVSALLIISAFWANVKPIYAASISYSPACPITGAPNSTLGIFTVVPASGTLIFTVNDTTNGQTFTDSGPVTGGYQAASGTVIIGAGDIVQVTFNLSTGDSITAYPCGQPVAGGGTSSLFHDGRINNNDGAETVAIYCRADGSIDILAIQPNGQGVLAFVALPSDIAQVPVRPSVNRAIKSALGATLYRLTTGELQVNRAEERTGKMYAFIFNGCPQPVGNVVIVEPDVNQDGTVDYAQFNSANNTIEIVSGLDRTILRVLTPTKSVGATSYPLLSKCLQYQNVSVALAGSKAHGYAVTFKANGAVNTANVSTCKATFVNAAAAASAAGKDGLAAAIKDLQKAAKSAAPPDANSQLAAAQKTAYVAYQKAFDAAMTANGRNCTAARATALKDPAYLAAKQASDAITAIGATFVKIQDAARLSVLVDFDLQSAATGVANSLAGIGIGSSATVAYIDAIEVASYFSHAASDYATIAADADYIATTDTQAALDAANAATALAAKDPTRAATEAKAAAAYSAAAAKAGAVATTAKAIGYLAQTAADAAQAYSDIPFNAHINTTIRLE